MFYTLFLIIGLSAALQYKTGETFSYQYRSHVDNVATKEGEENKKLQFEMSCTATFRVLSVVEDGAFMELVLTNVKNKMGANGQMEDAQADNVTEYAYSKPLYFKIVNDGSITDVCGSEEDSSDLINIKVNVAYSLRAPLLSSDGVGYTKKAVIDPLGRHYEYVETSEAGNTKTIKTQFSENDFIAFSDRNMNEGIFSVDSDATHEIVSQRITVASGNMVVVFNKESNSLTEAGTRIMASGKYLLDTYKKGNYASIEPNLKYTNVHQFLKMNKHYKRVPYLSEIFYQRRFVSLQEQTHKFAETTCPGNIDFCKSAEYTWGVGNEDLGLYFRAAALVGVTTGCTEEHRSYMAGAYVQFDILLLQRSIPAVDCYAEYGQVDGVPLRNAVSLSLFTIEFFHQDLPYLNCITNVIPIAAYNHTFMYPYNTTVYFVTFQFYVSCYVSLSADVTYTVCIMEFRASISFIPRAQVTVSGGAEASTYIGRAGIEITGSIADHLDPTVYVDGNLCRIGFKMSNIVEPFTAVLEGYYQFLQLVFRDWHIYIEMGPKHIVPIWSYTWPGRTDKIVDVYWGAK